ncbi:hypothetical protein SH528x_000608 [Novipirellula sp. SH528]|uniref:hypothetical protein n=1 Tax=Novipirellula sp. SH528 TaxID=3454466 RepID=UPI003F9F7485
MNGTQFQIGLVAGIFFIGMVNATLADDFRKASGQHIEITSDIESDAEINELVTSFDAAVNQWRDFWGLPEHALDSWSVKAFVMKDKTPFMRAGLIDPRVPNFQQGYALGNSIWMMTQPSEYYTRHLLLHEGVHSLANDQFGGAGPSWFMEGTAELLATHEGRGATTRINRFPADRDSVPYWGRLKLISQRRDEDKIPTLETVMRYPRDLNSDAERYGWCWAAAMLLSEYDDYRDVLVASAKSGRDSGSNFTRQIYQRLLPQWPAVIARWRLMCNELDYGFDWKREQVALSVHDPQWNGQAISLNVEAGKGWQSLGVRVPPGIRINISAEGRCVIAKREKVWESEASGVTIQYAKGRPLGQLIGCLVSLRHSGQPECEPLPIFTVGNATEIQTTAESWLVLQINDSVADRADNSGGYTVTISPEK